MYLWETRGIGNLKFGITHGTLGEKPNGYAVGKHWMDVMVKMWREDIKNGLLFESELYQDDQFPSWWLERILR